jgi:subfamily B ATP-binding cassette protein MsbA
MIRPFLALFFVSILFDIGMTLLGLCPPLFMRLLFDYAYPYHDMGLMNTAILSIVAVYFIYFALSVASDYLQIYIHQEVSASLMLKVFDAIQRLSLSFHHEKKPGDLLTRITDDVQRTSASIVNILPTVVIDGGKFLIILAIALYINSKLTVLALLAIPLYLLETYFFAGRNAAAEVEAIDADCSIFTRIQERLSNIKTIKAFGQERQEAASFGNLIRRRFRIGIKQKALDVARVFTNSVTLQAWSIFLAWYLGFLTVNGRMTIGEVVALMLYFEQLGGPIKAFIDMFADLKVNLVSMRRLDEVLDAVPESAEGGLKELSVSDGGIKAAGISFSYLPESEVLHGIDATFAPHNMTAIVGTSGSGKTTLADLLLRFFRPNQGAIFVDGQDISEVKLCSLRNRIGMITQDASLFDGSIIENILYGNEGLDRGDAMRAAKMASAADFIERLPGKYDTQVGIGGCLLSGGQRQRIAIARALLKNPSIIIFDEATSALDADSEYHIQEVMRQLRQQKTVIVIAHRLSTIKSADRILVLEDGKFVEEGQFDDLIEKRGAFYKFYWRQFGGLAAFRQHLALEYERTSRYGSKFCLALLRVGGYDAMSADEGVEAADRFVDAIEYRIKKKIRIGDDCARLEKDVILMLLPEISEAQLMQFFVRMKSVLPAAAEPAVDHPVMVEELLFTGVRITKKSLRTPDDLIAAIKAQIPAAKAGEVGRVIREEEMSL